MHRKYVHGEWLTHASTIVTLSGKINHLVLFMKSEIITPPESPSIADHSGTLIFLIGLTILELWAFKCGQYADLFNLHEQFKTRVNPERVGLPVCYVPGLQLDPFSEL